MVVLGVSLMVLCLALTGAVVYLARQGVVAAREEAIRLALFADSAMSHMRAETIEKKVKADALKKQYDIELEMLKDTYAKQVKQEEAAEPPMPKFVKVVRANGQTEEVNLQDYEIA